VPSRRRLAAAAAALALALGWPAAARPHGVTHQIERRGDAWAVRVRAHGGKPLVAATYQVMRPGSDDPLEQGKTGADGWVTFTPDEQGTWRVRIADAEGHGRVVNVNVTEVPQVAGAGPATLSTTSTSTTTTTTTDPTPTSTAPSAHPERSAAEGGAESKGADDSPTPLRIAAGTAGILAVFVAMWALRRHRAPGR
jgi:hypothetical protein